MNCWYCIRYYALPAVLDNVANNTEAYGDCNPDCAKPYIAMTSKSTEKSCIPTSAIQKKQKVQNKF